MVCSGDSLHTNWVRIKWASTEVALEFRFFGKKKNPVDLEALCSAHAMMQKNGW